jgi:hypothetical protein
MEWNIFFKNLQGFDVRRRTDGCVQGKCGLWNKYTELQDEESLIQIIKGEHELYSLEQKKWWNDKGYFGPLEGEIKSRMFKNCPEENKKKKRFKNE